MSTGTEGSGASRGGGDDFHNEDSFRVDEGLGLYLVCDGASRSPAGEIASRLVVDTVTKFVGRAESYLGKDVWRSSESTEVVHNALVYGLRSVLDAAQKHPELSGMSTTATMLLAHGKQGLIGHAGDSRAYLIRRGAGHQLTVDHDLTDALPSGDRSGFEIDTFSLRLKPKDTLILCTDGAENVVQEDAIVRAAADTSPSVLASRIVSAAHRRDASVDATAVVVRVRTDSEPGWFDLSVIPREVPFGHAVAFA